MDNPGMRSANKQLNRVMSLWGRMDAFFFFLVVVTVYFFVIGVYSGRFIYQFL